MNSMQLFLSIGLGISPLLLSGASSVEAEEKNPAAVIELFTSQGCSSCPPADKLIGKLAKREDLVVLTLPVDYWDYLGWKDTLASPENSERQRAYARVRDDRAVYTPQVVVSGKAHVVGSHEANINQLISSFQPLPVSIDLSIDEETINIGINGALPESFDSATVLIAPIIKEKTIQIYRGENRNRKITYTNIVENMQPIGKWDGTPQELTYPLNRLYQEESDRLAIIVQLKEQGKPSEIIGAAYY